MLNLSLYSLPSDGFRPRLQRYSHGHHAIIVRSGRRPSPPVALSHKGSTFRQ
jgi:hypothetical protein